MPNRREFLQLASTALAAAALPTLARAAAPAKKVSLGFSLYGMKSLPIATAVAECARIGYRNVELALMTGFPTDPAKLAPADGDAIAAQVAKLGLSVSSILVNLSLVGDERTHTTALETIRFAGEFAHRLDAKNPPLIQTVMGGKPDAWDAAKDGMATRLRAWAAAAAAVDATIAVKGHVNAAVDSPERLLWIIAQAKSPRIVVAYDHSHYELGGVAMEESWRQLAPSTRFVHVKEARCEGKNVQFLLPGEGATDYRRYFSTLHGAGYTGPVVVEVSSQIFSRAGYDPVQAAEKSYAALVGPLAASTGAAR